MTIDEVLELNENQIFDRKSIKIKPVDLSSTICALANADGGTIAIGISDKHRIIEGVDYHVELLNEILRTPIDFCKPTVQVTTELVECVNCDGKPDHVLLMHIDASPMLHANQADEVFLRIGDKSKKLDFNDRMTLMYAKGVRYYEDEPVADASIDDLDLNFVKEYCQLIGYTKSPENYVRENKNFVTMKNGKEQVSAAAILLFGINPQLFFPRACIRFIRFDGTEAKVGKDMNVVKDVIFEGRILDQVEKAVDFIKIQMKEKTYLGHDGIFVTKEEYQEFVRTEMVVNAVAHRDYGIKGTDIQIKMFDDRLEVDSPGSFAGMVNKDNIRYTHFSRNPKIATFLKDYGYVKEYGEGVDRMCKELESIGLPAPVFNNSTFILKTMVRSAIYRIRQNNASIRGENASIRPNNASIRGKNASIRGENASIRGENASIRSNNAPIRGENASIQPNNASIYADGVLSDKKKLLIEKLNRMEVSGKISIKYATEAKAVITGTDILQVITYKDVMVILSCQTTKARLILKKMEENDLIRAVQGKGKGKYVLAVPDICSED